MQWAEGRQQSGYVKKTLYSFNLLGIGLDCHLIKYPTGSSIPEHVDKVEDKSHRRLNIILKKAALGGIFRKNGKDNFGRFGRFHYFRPDIDKHEVTTIDKGQRMVLSFGIAS